ncbi:MAG: hypothetical protein ACE15D_12060 [Candidatus Eisenbacteria bacterium]
MRPGGTPDFPAIGDPREAAQVRLEIPSLAAGSPNLPDPLFLVAPGRDVSEIRIDGLPAHPLRWPETLFLPVPLVAVDSVCLRRFSPADGPLSQTGGPRIDVRLARPPSDVAESVVRLTRANYATFAEEIALRRPVGPLLFSLYYGDTKSAGRRLWGRQFGETIGLRMAHRAGRGVLEWGYDDDEQQFSLPATRKGTWDRNAVTVRYQRPDSIATSIEAAATFQDVEAGWASGLGPNERESRSLFARLLAQRPLAAGTGVAVAEIDAARTRYAIDGGGHHRHRDLSFGLAGGWEGGGTGGWDAKLSAGFARIAPFDPSPIFGAEASLRGRIVPYFALYASRGVGAPSLPRLATDGRAWVLQGIGLAGSKPGDAPASALTLGIEAGTDRSARAVVTAGVEALRTDHSLAPGSSVVPLLGIDRQRELSPAELDASAHFFSPWAGIESRLRYGFFAGAGARGTIAEEGVRAHAGVPEARWNGWLGWRGALFRRSLDLDLRVTGEGRSRVATPYGTLPAMEWLEGQARGRIGDAELFFVLANLTNVDTPSWSWDGSFMSMPRRHYRAGVRWAFFD